MSWVYSSASTRPSPVIPRASESGFSILRRSAVLADRPSGMSTIPYTVMVVFSAVLIALNATLRESRGSGPGSHRLPGLQRGKRARTAAVIMESPPSFDRETGLRVHQLLGVYADKGERPSNIVVFDDVVALLRAFPYSGRRRPGPQRVASLTAVGLSLMPPIEWKTLGCETATDPGRLDVLWQAPRSFVPAPLGIVIDEWKAGGIPGYLKIAEVPDQVGRYIRFGVRTFGDRFKGVRLLALSSPGSSVFYKPDGDGVTARPLLDTDFWFGPRPGEVV